MRIAIVTYALMVGGVERVILNLNKGFTDLGHEVVVFETQWKGLWSDFFISKGLHVKKVFPSKFRSKVYHAKRIIRLLQDFDIVLLNDVPYVQSALGFLPSNCISFPILHGNLESMILNAKANHSQWNQLICVSPFMKKRLLDLEVLEEKQITYIPNGIEIVPTTPKEFDHGPKRIVFLGRLSNSEKGVLDIPEIIALIPNFRERIATVDIFGLGPDEAKLIQLINELDLQDVISIKGQIEPENSAAVLKNYDFLLLPSYTEGGHPLVMLEAMAVGTIPIVSRLSDVTDNVIISGENGFLAIPVNPKSFAVVMDQAFRSSDLENISTASKDTVAKRFTVQQMVKRYVSLFDYHRTNAVKIKRSQVLELDILGDLPFLPILAIRPIRKMLRILEQKISFIKSETSTLLINK